MSQQAEAELHKLFDQLKQTDIEGDQEAYAGVETDTEKLEWLKSLSRDLQDAVDTKERAIADLESEVDDLRAVEKALKKVTHRVRLRLGIDLVDGQLPLPEIATEAVEPVV